MRNILALLSILLLLASHPLHASSSGGGGPSPYAKLETFTVNLQGLTQYLQVDMSLKVGDPKTADTLKAWSPVIRHEIILLLSSQKGEELATLAGKKKVMSAIKNTINNTLKLNETSGVTDVLFESFVIQ